MSQENVERTLRLLALSTNDQYDAALELLHDDVSGYPLVSAVEGGYHGHEGIRAWWANLRDSFLGYVIDVQDTRDLGDLVLAQLWFHGRGTASNTPFELHVWYLVEWREGKALWLHAYATEAEALEAARERR
jgi:ketosteroid isomerase-like protein